MKAQTQFLPMAPHHCDPPEGNPSISWPLERQTNRSNGAHLPSTLVTPNSRPMDSSLLPKGSRSLSGIALRSFLLGLVFASTLILSLSLSPFGPASHPLWRVPWFLMTLSVFHFLEFYITAAYNTREATIS